MKLIRIALMVLSSYAWSNLCRADDAPIIQVLFNEAVEASGERYYKLRDELIEHGEIAVPYIRTALCDQRLHARIVARAMIAWLSQADGKELRGGDVLAKVLPGHGAAGSLHVAVESMPITMRKRMWSSDDSFHAYDVIAYDLVISMQHMGDPDEVLRGTIADDRIKARNIDGVYLMEALLKGFPQKWRMQVGADACPDYINELARGYVAALCGGFVREDAVPLLSEMLKLEESVVLRCGVVSGLRRVPNRLESVPLIIEALRDESVEVRLTAYHALRQISGDGMAGDQDGRWEVGEIQIVAAEKWWAENKKRLIQEQEKAKHFQSSTLDD